MRTSSITSLAILASAFVTHNAYATPIVINSYTTTPAGVTASSFLPGGFDRSPVHTIDNSGLTGNQHATGSANGTMWTSTGNGLGSFTPDYSPTITFDLGSIKSVTAMDIWNYNENVPGSYTNMYLGADKVQVLAGATLGTLAPVGGPVNFTEATGLSNYTGNVMPMTINNVEFVQLQILSNFDGATFTGAPNGSNGGAVDGRYLTGFSEVKFQVTPEPSTFVLGGLAAVGLLIAGRNRKRLCGTPLVKVVSCFLLVSLVIGSVSHASLIASYNPDKSLQGPVTTMADQSGNGNTLTGLVTISNANNAVFNGHNYGNFTSPSTAGLGTTGALYTGGNDRTVAAVYSLPNITGSATNGSGTFMAQIAGEIPGTGSFGIEARGNNVVGSPYLINFGPDVSSTNAPVANQLTFAVATYNSATTTETLYWAYGTSGAINSASAVTTLNTASFPFAVGNGNDTCCGTGGSQIGQVQVYNTAFNLAAATAEIQSLQRYYAQSAPEPSTFVLGGLGLVGLLAAWRRRKSG